MKLDLDELERDAIGAGSCYDGINPDEALLLIRIARAAVAWRDGDSHAWVPLEAALREAGI